MIIRTGSFKKLRPSRESGQAMLFLLLALGLFLLAGVGLAVDMADLWMHRQASQNAADAACTAAAMDMVNFANGGTNTSGFTPGTAFNCSSNSSAAPCKYAGFNGYSATGLTAGTPSTEVAVSFPTSVPSVQTCSSTNPPPSVCTEVGFPTTAFVRATVTDRTRTFLIGLLSGGTTMDVGAMASCGAVLSNAPIPLLVLNPSVSGALSMSGNPNISLYGGPQRSIQVNSSSSTAASSNGNISVNLSQGGPNLSGSDFGAYGGPSSACCNPSFGTTGHWLQPAIPISDPFAQIPAPAQPTHVGTTTSVGFNVNGCPDSGGCTEFSPGYYSGGISVKNFSAIFDPGVYYVLGGFSMAANSCAWPSTATGDGSGGTMFYFADSNSVAVAANAGKKCPATTFNMTSGSGSLQFGAKCTAASNAPANLPATTTGTILLAPCHAPTVTALCTPNCSINYGDPLGTNDPEGEQRGMLFFQKRSTATAASGNWSGGGQFLLSGNIYIHQCVTSGSDTGAGCSSTAYTDSMSFGGNSGANNYVVGDIVVDQLNMHGTPGIAFDLNPNAVYFLLKASLLQ